MKVLKLIVGSPQSETLPQHPGAKELQGATVNEELGKTVVGEPRS